VETCWLLLQQCFTVGEYYQATESLPKTGISVETCWLLLQQCFNLGYFTNQRNTYLTLVSPFKRVYICKKSALMWSILPSKGMLISPWKHVYRCHKTQCGRFHKCYSQYHGFNYLYPRKITFWSVRRIYLNPNIWRISKHLCCDMTPTSRNIRNGIVT
jgi:hypothetical protein